MISIRAVSSELFIVENDTVVVRGTFDLFAANLTISVVINVCQ